MLNLHKVFKENNKTKQGETFTSVIVAIQGIVIFVVIAAMFAYFLNHGGL